MKRKLQVDDSLDVFPVHGVGGALGTLLTGVFASATLGIFSGQQEISIIQQLKVQATGVGSALVYTAALTFVVLKVVNVITPLRVTDEQETEGLDIVLHNERGYDL